MQTVSEIEDFFVLLKSPFLTPKKDFIAFSLEEYDEKPHTRSIDCFRTLFYRVTLYENDSCEFAFNNYPMQTTRSYTVTFSSPFHIGNFNQKSALKGLSFYFSESFVKHAFRNGEFHKDFPFFWSNRNVFYINESSARILLALGEKVIYEYKNNDPLSESILGDYLHIFLLKSKRIVGADYIIEDNSADYNLLQQFYQLVNNSYPVLRSVEAAASAMSVTPARLWSAVKKLTGQRPLEIINQRIITEARSLLQQSKLTISEIGFYLEFKEKSHFTRFFKNLTGISPLDYSRQFRIKK